MNNMYYVSRLAVEIGARNFEVQSKGDFFYNHFQFFLVQKGGISITFKSANKEFILHENDIILIEPNTEAVISPIANLSNAVLGVRVDESFMRSILPYGYHFVCNSTTNNQKDYGELNRILSKLSSNFFIGDSEFIIYSNLYTLADVLSRHFSEPDNITSKKNNEDYSFKRIKEIHDYVNSNFYQPITLSDLAEKMFLTPQYLSRFIKEHMGTTFTNYLSDTRLSYALTELQSTDSSITSIALNNGFPNVSAFNKAFREKYKVSPSAWRQANSLKLLKNAPPGFTRIESETTESNIISVHADALSTSTYSKIWQDTINIGPYTNLLSKDTQNAFCKYQEFLRFKYVRLENIFEPKSIDHSEYNINNINSVFDFLHEQNAYPHIELTYKATESSAITRDFVENNFGIDINTLEEVLMHCINRYGHQYVSMWKFEMWLPNHNGFYYSISPERYANCYQRAYNAIKTLISNVKIGGVGFNICSHNDIIENYLQTFNNLNLKFDFLSFYSFGYKPVNLYTSKDDISRAVLSSNPSNAKDGIRNIKEIIKKTGYKNTPICITEFTSTLSANNYIYYSLFQSAFICKNMVDLLNEVSSVAYLRFSENSSKSYFPTNEVSAKSSLLYFGNIPTPALHSYIMLSKLGDNLISHGSNYIITSDSSSYQVLLYNYSHFNENFRLNSSNKIEPKDTYTVFENLSDINLNITCSNIKSGRYKIIKRSLCKEHGSILDMLLENYTTSEKLAKLFLNLSKDEIEYYKQTVLPKQEIFYKNFSNEISFETKLEPLEVQLFEFTLV
jgi:xylan 1,4-beta-xylosidase